MVVPVRLSELVDRFGGMLHGSGDILIHRIAPLDSAHAGDLAFLSNPKYRARLGETKASAVILSGFAADCPVAAIVTPQPYLYFARIAQWFSPLPEARPGCHPSAVIQGDVSPFAEIGPNCHVAAKATIGPGAILGANCVIGEAVKIGTETRLSANVTVYHACQIGSRCIIHGGAVIGSDGFGFARDAGGEWVKIPQNGRVLIGDDVEIGAGTTIDRGALDDTVIGDGVKLDNQIQIGHNVVVGAHTAMAGCVGIAGSARIGARCTVGGGAVILGHLLIGDDVNISAGTLIGKSIPGPGTYSGTVPFLEHGKWLRNFSHLRHLETMADKIRALEARLAALENKR